MRPHVRLVAAWDRYWFGGVAAVRPYLLMKVLWCVLAFDVWLLRVPAGGRYGAGDFGVAHFNWLDALQPLPSPGLYVGLMLAVGMLALVCALIDAGCWVRALVALLYTYGWAMSLHDGYQHHYFLSLALVTLVFFPRLRGCDLFPTEAKRGRRRHPPRPSRRIVSAWAYALLGTTVGIVYAYTALTKLDTEWQAGGVMGRLGRRSVGPIVAQLADAGVAPERLWAMQGLGVFAVECLVAVGYLLAVGLDQGRRRWLRTVTGLALLGGVGFHVSAEVLLGLRIGWFSYYMIALACVFFLPASVLWTIGALVHGSAAGVAAFVRERAGGAEMARAGPTTLAVVSGAVLVVAICWSLDLPGALMVGFLAAAALVTAGVVALVVRGYRDALRYALATVLTGALMWVAVGQSQVRSVYHASVGKDLQRRGDRAGALAAFARASQYAPGDKALVSYERRVRGRVARTEE